MTPRLDAAARQDNTAAPRGAPPLGQLLLHAGVLDHADLTDALERARGTGRRLGEVLVSEGTVGASDIATALARQAGLATVDIASTPPDAKLADPRDLDTYLAYGVVPWRRLGALTLFATSDPARAAEAMGQLADKPPFAFWAVAAPGDVEHTILAGCGPVLAERGARLLPAEHSVRGLAGLRLGAGLALLVMLALMLASGLPVLILAAVPLAVLSVSTTAIRLAALLAGSLRQPERHTPPGAPVRLSDKRPLPKVSLLVPLLREAEMVPRIVAALERLDYPRPLLEVRLLLEASDSATIAAAQTADLPPWITPLIVPDGQPRTKPRALNIALDFCSGEIVGILDAEDRPDPGQLRAVAERLRNAPPETACVQCQLSYYNARENWITRCFQIEYSIWFDVLLRGFQRLGLPIPLGGTSVYLRRAALTRIGGWDAHNVTEDADLGIRLARAGLRCDVLSSTTYEEANCRVMPWIRQRSRWLKGYLLTWLSHMRAPARLWRDVGPLGFFGVNVLFLGGAVTYLAMPLFWAAILSWIVSGQSVFAGVLPDGAVRALGWVLGLGQAVMLGCAVLALRRRRALGLFGWVWTLPFYWTLGAIAAWKAAIEAAAAPYYWDKTRHGLSRVKPGSATDPS